MNMKFKNTYIYVFLIIIFGLIFLFLKNYKAPIINGVRLVNFEEKRDRLFIKQVINDDYDWLVNYPNFDVDFMIDNKVPSKERMEHLGKLNIKVLVDNEKPVGFLTYHPKNFRTAWIQFLAISKEARGKGYAKRILEDIFAELKEKGFENVQLLTRTNNERARNLYEKMGFELTESDPSGIVYFNKNF